MVIRFSLRLTLFRLTIFFRQALEDRIGVTHRQVELRCNRAHHSFRQMSLLLDVTGRGDENADCLHEATPRVDGIPYQWHHLQEFSRCLETAHRVLREEYLKQNDERLRNTVELF